MPEVACGLEGAPALLTLVQPGQGAGQGPQGPCEEAGSSSYRVPHGQGREEGSPTHGGSSAALASLERGAHTVMGC